MKTNSLKKEKQRKGRLLFLIPATHRLVYDSFRSSKTKTTREQRNSLILSTCMMAFHSSGSEAQKAPQHHHHPHKNTPQGSQGFSKSSPVLSAVYQEAPNDSLRR